MADKKLVRSANKKIAGVCGGLAEYVGMDATIVRIIYLLATIFTASASACATLILASACPSASKIAACFIPSAFLISDSRIASAFKIWAFFS